MKTVIISSTFLIGMVGQAMAVCPSTFQIKDNLGATGNVVYSDSSGNCLPNVVINGATFNANGQATMANSSPVVLPSNQKVADPCMFQAKTNLAVNVATAVSVQLVGLSTGQTIYICSLSLIGSTATVFSLTYGTGTACATSPTAVIGGATATTSVGLSLAANGGLTLGNGQGTVALTGSGAELCLIQSGSGVIAGNLTYIQQ